jgi:Leucine-rich repeat (LRR) protein
MCCTTNYTTYLRSPHRNLNQNGIVDVEGGAFSQYGSLEILRLVGNSITEVVPTMFDGLTSLGELWLNNNPITILKVSAC